MASLLPGDEVGIGRRSQPSTRRWRSTSTRVASVFGIPSWRGARMSSLLEHPAARRLLADAEVTADDLRGCGLHLEAFLRRYLPRFYRVEQHGLARAILRGKLSPLQRKTSEPIAALDGRHRKPLQHFVGAGAWDDEAVAEDLRRHVAQERPDPDAVLVIDPSAFPKSGGSS